jgi:hypothetical protein
MNLRLIVLSAVFPLMLLSAPSLPEPDQCLIQPDLCETQAAGQASSSVYLPFVFDPFCADHDPNVWHGLRGSGGCYYRHEHKDDPSGLDDVFGPVAYSISYPWQTPGENHHKHESYGYTVLRDLPPAASSGTDWYIRHLRIQSHFDLNVIGAPNRFHSTYVEVMACRRNNPDDCGTARWGGHQDYGELRIDGVHIPLPNDDPGYDPNNDDVINARNHSASSNVVDWIGRFHTVGTGGVVPINYAGFQHQTRDAFGPLDPNDLGRVILTDPAVYNNSTLRLVFFVIRNRQQMFPDSGRLTWTGYTYAATLLANPACTAPGPDCVPMVLENWPYLHSLSYNARAAGSPWGDFRDYDDGTRVIRFPN